LILHRIDSVELIFVDEEENRWVRGIKSTLHFQRERRQNGHGRVSAVVTYGEFVPVDIPVHDRPTQAPVSDSPADASLLEVPLETEPDGVFEAVDSPADEESTEGEIASGSLNISSVTTNPISSQSNLAIDTRERSMLAIASSLREHGNLQHLIQVPPSLRRQVQFILNRPGVSPLIKQKLHRAIQSGSVARIRLVLNEFQSNHGSSMQMGLNAYMGAATLNMGSTLGMAKVAVML